jgi:hypothetical protein
MTLLDAISFAIMSQFSKEDLLVDGIEGFCQSNDGADAIFLETVVPALSCTLSSTAIQVQRFDQTT